jgi:CheY-like chemotaxis protein
MDFNVLVAEPCHADWLSILAGIKQYLPHASLFRVKDGEQAIRFLFYRGLLTDDPQTPNLVLLAGELSRVSAQDVLARLRHHPRTRETPVIVLLRQHEAGTCDLREALSAYERVLVLCALDVANQVAQAVHHLCGPHALANPPRGAGTSTRDDK